ncbi:hypothetical protein [Sphingosinicella soli]|uniref:Uncharacterized protein n=1 Tax=Sphingosinicella soli TaxID=333708 RepID=A0A7W7B4A8_9SPHN|nr:hypothetical protein [Sphingosinicella soli]MBB4633774.1 hypothetical protein [Sphingosinicella soli]
MSNRAHLEATLSAIMPACIDPDERALRLRLLAGRNISADEIGRWAHNSDLRLRLYACANELASGYAFARVGLDHLLLAADTSRSIIMAASNIRTLEGAPDA